jgi:hypothetical protein
MFADQDSHDPHEQPGLFFDWPELETGTPEIGSWRRKEDGVLR